MSLIMRRLIAARVAQATSHSEEVILPLITPVVAGKKSSGFDLNFGLSMKALKNRGEAKSKGKREDTSILNKEAWAIAQKVVCPEHVHNVTAENGILQFKMNPETVIKHVLHQVQEKQTAFGYEPYPWQQQGQNVIVEFSSPNIAKPFHAGHLRSTLIGNFVANLQSSLGHNVTRINYLGDWGTQFGLLVVGFQEFGNEEALTLDPIQHLYEVYVAVNKAVENDASIWDRAKQYFSQMEEGDSSSLQMWQKFRELSISEYTKTYERLGIHFDEYCSEAQYSHQAKSLLTDLRQRGLLQVSEKGTGVVDVADSCPRLPTAILAKSDGSSLYLTRDVAAAVDRRQRFGFDRMYYVVDKSQAIHFEQLKGVLQKMDQAWSTGIHHVQFGRVLGMQTRKGQAVFLTDILDEAKSRMLHNMKSTATTKELEDQERVAEVLGMSAIILQDLRASLTTDYEFDWDRVLTSQGDTGVFLQYTHARLCSIEAGIDWTPSCPSDVDSSLLSEPEAVQLVWHIGHYDIAVQKAAEEIQPKAVVKYLLRLCHLVSKANKTLRVKGSPEDVARARLLLFSSARTTLSNGMHLLGIQPLKRM